jgi:1-acyl-sn-glycerol-3-phosphate acyltransferase
MSASLLACLIIAVIIFLVLVIGYLNAPADWGAYWLTALLGLNRLFCLRFHGLRSDPLPVRQGRATLLAPNHTAGLDPMLIVALSPRPIRFLVDEEWYEQPGLRWIFRAMGCIRVSMDRHPQKAFYEALTRLEAGEIVAVFPQGGLHPAGRLKRGVAKLAALSGVPITPLRISGVGSPGSVVKSVIVRSEARLEVGDAIPVAIDGEADALRDLRHFLVPEDDC